MKIYKSLIIPHFDYADVCYDAMTQKNAQKLQTLQNTCIRICLQRDKRSNVTQLHADSKLLTLAERRKMHGCNMVYNGLHGKSSAGLNNMFVSLSEVRTRDTRASANLEVDIPRCNLEVTKSNFRIRGGNYYNNLPTEVKQAETLNSFKRRQNKTLS